MKFEKITHFFVSPQVLGTRSHGTKSPNRPFFFSITGTFFKNHYQMFLQLALALPSQLEDEIPFARKFFHAFLKNRFGLLSKKGRILFKSFGCMCFLLGVGVGKNQHLHFFSGFFLATKSSQPKKTVNLTGVTFPSFGWIDEMEGPESERWWN